LKLTGKSDAGDSLSDTEELAIRVKCDEKEYSVELCGKSRSQHKRVLVRSNLSNPSLDILKKDDS
jgi:hypothetical protein